MINILQKEISELKEMVLSQKKEIEILKAKQQELEDQKKFYQIILNHLPADIAVFDTDYRYKFANPMAFKNPDIRKWVIGKNDFEYFAYRGKDLSYAQNRVKIFDQARENKKEVEIEERMIDHLGEEKHYLRRVYPVFDDQSNLWMMIAYGMDITNRKKIEDQLSKSEELYRLVIEASNDGIWDWHINTNYVHFNKRLKEMFGYKEDELKDSLETWHFLMHPDDLKIAQNLLQEHFENNTPFHYTLRFFHKNGEIRWIMCKGFALRTEEGKPYRMVGSYSDVTEMQTYAKALEQAKEAAEESSRTKELFLANMSHEMRTPLNGILGMVKLLDRSPVEDTQREYLNVIKYSANNLLIIINDLLDFAKIEAGKLVLDNIAFDIAEVINSVIHPLQYQANLKGISLSVVSNLEELNVIGDPFRLSQIITNLLNNAIKFTDQGRVELSIDITTEGESYKVIFQVIDTGIGIPANKLESIFESFSQAHRNTAYKYGGTGLGLAICKQLTELQGGTISVESTVNKGSIFKVELCYPKAKSILVEKPSNIDNIEYSQLKGIKVLLAEDNEVNQFLACELLKQWQVVVEVASNGKEALELFKEKEYDLILMDIQMPLLGGVEATQAIRQYTNPKKASIPIIALTANAIKGEKEKYLKSGMDDCITKPFEENELYVAMVNQMTKSNISNNKTLLYDYIQLGKVSYGNKDFEKKLLNIFIETVPTSLSYLEKCLRELDYEGLFATIHKLKTTVHSMRIHVLKNHLNTAEELIKSGNSQGQLHENIEFITKVLSSLVSEFELKMKDYA